MPSFVFGIKLEMQELEKKAQSHPLLLIRWLGEPKHMRNHPVAPQEPITRKDRVTSCHPGVQIRIFFFFFLNFGSKSHSVPGCEVHRFLPHWHFCLLKGRCSEVVNIHTWLST